MLYNVHLGLSNVETTEQWKLLVYEDSKMFLPFFLEDILPPEKKEEYSSHEEWGFSYHLFAELGFMRQFLFQWRLGCSQLGTTKYILSQGCKFPDVWCWLAPSLGKSMVCSPIKLSLTKLMQNFFFSTYAISWLLCIPSQVIWNFLLP